jgi:hypothetical protein
MENKSAEKKTYTQPEITTVEIDADISLALESDPPNPGNEHVSIEYYQIVHLFK